MRRKPSAEQLALVDAYAPGSPTIVVPAPSCLYCEMPCEPEEGRDWRGCKACSALTPRERVALYCRRLERGKARR